MASIFKPKGSSKFVIVYTDETGRRRKKTGATDKACTRQIAADLEKAVERRKVGIIGTKDEVYRDHWAKPLAEHFAAWRSNMAATGATEKHVELFANRAARVVAIIRGASLCDIEPARNATHKQIADAAATLSGIIKSARLSDLTDERVQHALATLKREGRSLATCNHHRAAIKAFSTWCSDKHRTREDILRGVTGFNAKKDRRHDRRTVSLDELHRLVEKAHNGPDFMGMSGPARALCYRLAVATGLRYSEIASITPESFDWQAPNVTVAAGYTKNGQTAELSLPADLAPDLDAYVATLPAGEPVFRLPPEKGAKMLRFDLAAAEIEYRDASGLVFDFHSLRCQTATLADAAGVSLGVVRDLMRHSTSTLTSRYTRPRIADIKAAASKLPSLKPADKPTEQAVMTGTDFRPISTGGATVGVTKENADACNSRRENSLASIGRRSHNPQVSGSSPDPGTVILQGKSASFPVFTAASTQRRDTTPIGQNVAQRDPSGLRRATKSATAHLAVDPDLELIQAAWASLPEAVRAGILAMVRASQEGGTR